MSSKDHAGVWFPPPLLFALPHLAAAALDAVRPWPILSSHGMTSASAAMLVIAIAVAMGLMSVTSFRNASTTILPAGRPTTAIVERGAYGLTRNPMYLAMAGAYLGLAILLNNRWALLLLPVVIAVVDRFVIRREERYLTAKFGEPYLRYCSRVRRWI